MPLISIDKFIGGLHKPETTSDIQIGPSDATDVLNVEYYPRGAISKRAGYLSYTMSSSPISGVMNIFPWRDASYNSTTLIFTPTSGATVSADIYTLSVANNIATCTQVYSAHKYSSTMWNPTMSSTDVYVASYGGSAVAVAGGGGPPIIYSSTGGSAVPQTGTGGPPSGAQCIAAWGQYLFLGNVLAGGARKYSRVQWNSLGSISNWPAAYYIDLDPDDGDKITAMHLLGDYLVVFKRYKIFIVYWQGGVLLFKELRRSSGVGCVSGRTVVEHDQKLYFLADTGFYSFDGTNTKLLSTKIQSKIPDIDLKYPYWNHAILYDSHKQIWFAVSDKTATGGSDTDDDKKQANRIFVYDYELENWSIYDIPCSTFGNIVLSTDHTYSELILPYSSYTRTIGSYMGAESTAFLLGHAFQTDSSKKGCLSEYGVLGSDVTNTGINAYWQSVWFDLGDPGINKRYTRWTILADQESTTDDIDLDVELRENWKNSTYLLADGSASTWTVDLTGSSSSQIGLPMEIRIDTSRTCRAFQCKISNGVANDQFTIHKIVVDGIPKGRTKVP